MIRDFSENAKNDFYDAVERVSQPNSWGNALDVFTATDKNWISNLGINKNIVKVDEFQKSLFACRDKTRGDIDKIFTDVQKLETKYSNKLSNLNQYFSECINRFKDVADLMNPTSIKTIDIRLDKLDSSIEESKKIFEALMTKGDNEFDYFDYIVGKESWNELEAKIVAEVWKQAIKNKDINILNKIANKMRVEENEYITPLPGEEGYKEEGYSYVIGLKADKYNLVLSYLNPKTNGEAYFTLTRLKNCEKDINAKYYNGNEDYRRVFSDEIVFSLSDNNQIKCIWNYKEKYDGTDMLIKDENKVFTVSNLWKNIENKASYNNMKQLGFTDDEIVHLLGSVCSDYDEKFMNNLFAASTVDEYRSAFDLWAMGRPGLLYEGVVHKLDDMILTDTAQAGFVSYSTLLFDKCLCIDDKGKIDLNKSDLSKYETFINGMLKEQKESEVKNDYVEYRNNNNLAPTFSNEINYFKVMSNNLAQMLEINSSIIKSNYQDVPQDVITTQYELYYQYALIEQMKYLAKDDKTHTTSISELKISHKTEDVTNLGYINMSFNYYHPNLLAFRSETDKYSFYKLLPIKEEDHKKLTDYYKALQLPNTTEAAKKIAIESLSMLSPKIKTAIEVGSKIKKYYDQIDENGTISVKPSTILGYIPEGKIDDPDIKDIYKYGSKEYKLYEGLYDAIQEDDKAIESSYNKIMDLWYNSGFQVVMNNNEKDEDVNYVAAGMFEPNVIKGKETLYHKGLVSMAENQAAINQMKLYLEDKIEDHKFSGSETMDSISNSLNSYSEDEIIKIINCIWYGVDGQDESTVELVEKLKTDEYKAVVDQLDSITGDMSGEYANIYGNSGNALSAFIDKYQKVEGVN